MQEPFIELAIEELSRQQHNSTNQLLGSLVVPSEDGQPRIARVDRDDPDCAIVYFPVENRSFFLAVRVELGSDMTIRNCSIEAGTEAYLVSYSTSSSLDELLGLTNLEPAEQWDRSAGSSSSGLHIRTPMPLADSADDNINLLLDLLDEDPKGVRQLAAAARTYVQLHWYGHAASMPRLDFRPSTLQRLAALNLGLDVDLYVT